jgi:cystathionine beta-lyase/cystathionine gamma-synthase
MQQTAMMVAEFLTSCPEVEFVNYPGLESFQQRDLAFRQMIDYDGTFAPGAMIYFVLKGANPQEALCNAESFINHLAKHAYSITLAVSLGNIRTLVEHPASMTHSSIPAEEQVSKGIDPGGIRLSVGLERPEDIIRDLRHSLRRGVHKGEKSHAL